MQILVHLIMHLTLDAIACRETLGMFLSKIWLKRRGKVTEELPTCNNLRDWTVQRDAVQGYYIKIFIDQRKRSKKQNSKYVAQGISISSERTLYKIGSYLILHYLPKFSQLIHDSVVEEVARKVAVFRIHSNKRGALQHRKKRGRTALTSPAF